MKQYAASPVIQKLIEDWKSYFKTEWEEDFYNIVCNVDTAQGIGLDIWGRIVGVGRELRVPGQVLYFGFNEALPGSYPFGEQPFFNGTFPDSETYLLADDAYRILILAKAFANISSAGPQELNLILKSLFSDRGRAYVNDLGSMQMRYTFEFELLPYELAIITQSGVMPRPAGVKTSVLQTATPVFGFSEAGAGMAPFGQAPFLSQEAYDVID